MRALNFIFGYPGGAVLHIYDAIFNQDKVEHILVRHEQAASSYAADGYARATGKPVGVVLVTSGPWGNQRYYWYRDCLYGFYSHWWSSPGQVESRLIGTMDFKRRI